MHVTFSFASSRHAKTQTSKKYYMNFVGNLLLFPADK